MQTNDKKKHLQYLLNVIIVCKTIFYLKFIFILLMDKKTCYLKNL